MNRASPAELRKALEVANVFVRGGLRFVCVPVMDDADYATLQANASYRLEQIHQQAEQEEAQP